MCKGKVMDIRALKEESYKALVKDRPEILQKNRGYGIVSITIDDLTYAIPLRSNLNHSYGFKTIPVKRRNSLSWNGLDYSKALVIDKSDIEPGVFKLKDQAEFNKIQLNEKKIKSEFENYVSDYLDCAKNGTNTTDKRFKFSTLQYFHAELGI